MKRPLTRPLTDDELWDLQWYISSGSPSLDWWKSLRAIEQHYLVNPYPINTRIILRKQLPTVSVEKRPRQHLLTPGDEIIVMGKAFVSSKGIYVLPITGFNRRLEVQLWRLHFTTL